MKAAPAPGDFPDIGDYALLGDCRTAALVSRAGSVEWLCLPLFSNPSIFGAILDREAGHFQVHPVADARSSRKYLAETNVLETTLECEGGTLRLTDALALPMPGELEPQHELLRHVECVKGEVEIEVSFAPRPGYGRDRVGFARRGKLGWQLTGCAFGAFLASDIEELAHDRDGARLLARLRLKENDERWLSFCYDESEANVLMPLGGEAARRLRYTVEWWQGWSGRCRYEGPYRDLVLRSALALKLLTCSTSGAVVAAPTTSLPEITGGPRNWDYRFCWIRDSALVLHAFLALGYVEEAEAFLGWLLHATRLTWQRYQVMYDVYGETRIDEQELAHLSGYRGSKPVRIGNGAHGQLQLDIYGELMATVAQYVAAGGELDGTECRMLQGVGRRILKYWPCPDKGIWETRGPARQHTFSKAMCWVALERLREIGRRYGLGLDEDEMGRQSDALRAEIERRGYDDALGGYVGYYDGKEADASLLLLARYGYRDPGDPRMDGTWRLIQEQLQVNGWIRRYPDDSRYDGISAPENAFAACNFWAAEYLANAGRHDEAQEVFERTCACANDVGLFAEEIKIDGGAPIGNFPQAFTHVSLISAATALYQRKTA